MENRHFNCVQSLLWQLRLSIIQNAVVGDMNPNNIMLDEKGMKASVIPIRFITNKKNWKNIQVFSGCSRDVAAP